MIAKHSLGAGPVLYGLLGSSVGLGAIMGSLTIGTGRFGNHGSIFSLGAGLMLIALFAFSFSNSYFLSLCLLLIAGIGMSGFAVLQPIIVLQAIPSYMRGRALGVIALCIGFNPLGVFIVGQLAEIWGAQIGLSILSGIGILVMVIVRWRFPSLRG
jgi:MFS family permease